MTEIDEIDAKILKILQNDGRTSFREIARKIGVSSPTVQSHIQKLQEYGVLEKFTAVVNPTKIRGGILAMIVLTAEPSKIAEIANSLSKHDEILALHHTSGERNLIVKVVVSDVSELNKFITEVLGSIKGISGISSSIILESFKEEYGIRIKPGYGIRQFCIYCGKEILGKPVKRKIRGRELRFCCETCAKEFKKSLRTPET